MTTDNKQRLSITLDPLVHSEILATIAELSGKRKAIVLIELIRLGLEAASKGHTLGRIPQGSKLPVFDKAFTNTVLVKSGPITGSEKKAAGNTDEGNSRPNPVTYNYGSPPEYPIEGCTSIPVPKSSNQSSVSELPASPVAVDAEQQQGSDPDGKLNPKDKDAVTSFLDM